MQSLIILSCRACISVVGWCDQSGIISIDFLRNHLFMLILSNPEGDFVILMLSSFGPGFGCDIRGLIRLVTRNQFTEEDAHESLVS